MDTSDERSITFIHSDNQSQNLSDSFPQDSDTPALDDPFNSGSYAPRLSKHERINGPLPASERPVRAERSSTPPPSIFDEIPNEILLSILEMVIYSDDFDPVPAVLETSPPSTDSLRMAVFRPPTLLSQVCSRWRDLLLNVSKFWTNLHIVAPLDSAYSRLDMREWAMRACGQPLYLTFSDADFPYDEVPLDISNVIASFNQDLDSINLPLSVVALANVSKVGVTFPNLKFLKLDFLYDGRDDSLLSPEISTFMSSPNLTHVILSASFAMDFLQDVQLPYEQLVDLRLRDVYTFSPLFFDTIYAKGAQLQILHFSYPEYDAWMPPEIKAEYLEELSRRSPITSHTLVELCLTIEAVAAVPLLLDNLTCPNLERLDICHTEGTEYASREFVDTLKRFQTRSMFSLQELGLRGINDLTTEELVEILDSNETLRILDVYLCEKVGIKELLAKLVLPENGTDDRGVFVSEAEKTQQGPKHRILAPNLQRLYLAGAFESCKDESILDDVVSSRMYPLIPTLRYLSLEAIEASETKNYSFYRNGMCIWLS